MKTYKDAISYLDSFTNFESSGFKDLKDSLDLSRVDGVLQRMGRPDKSFRSIHVAGTKGKGSVCTFTASILEASGYKVGLFTSPHLHDILERIQINGKNVSPEKFTGALNEVAKHVGKSGDNFTYFEVLTLTAIMIFKNENVDFSVFETGLGGRLDATNIISPEVAAITPISFDHTDVLGETIEEIAGEKSGIIKSGSVCIISRQNDKAEKVIEKACEIRGSELLKVGKDIDCILKNESPEGSCFDIITSHRRYDDCCTKMPGHFQVENVLQAVCICERIIKEDIDIKKVKEGITAAFIPGRLEVLSKEPLLVIDGAQNEESSKKLKYSIEEIFKYDRLILLLGLSRDKDISGVCRNLSPMADSVVLTRARTERAIDPHILRGYFKGKKAHVTSDVKEAIGTALMNSGKNDLILATGSFYVIAEVRDLVLNGEINI